MRIKSTRNNSIEAKPSAMNHLCQIALGLVFFVLAGCGGGGNEVIGNTLGVTDTTNSLVANAGHGQVVAVGAAAQLNGSFSFGPPGKSLTYSWTLTSKPAGSKASIVLGTSATPILVPDIVGTYAVSLIVSNGSLKSPASTISLFAIRNTTSAIANAGANQSVVTKSTVRLNGVASTTPIGSSLTYSWTMTSRPVGSTAVLTSDKTVTPSFVADLAGTYVATLTVSDGSSISYPAMVTVTAGTGNVAPVANPGEAQSVLTGRTVQLSGRASYDANGNPLTYTWVLLAKPTGSGAALSALNAVSTTFVADVNGAYIASLTVNDGSLSSDPVSTVITASNENLLPLANAGTDQSGFTGVRVNLDGSLSSSVSGSPLTYGWTLTSKPTGSTAQLASSGTVSTSFLPDVSGSYVATLVVSDGKTTSQASNVLISISPSALTLLSMDSGQSGQIQPWPYTNSVAMNGGVNCVDTACDDFPVASFRLEASGRASTVANLAAVNLTDNTGVAAYVVGLANGQVIAEGQSVEFQLMSQATGGQTVALMYTFSILETGEVFSFNVELKTN